MPKRCTLAQAGEPRTGRKGDDLTFRSIKAAAVTVSRFVVALTILLCSGGGASFAQTDVQPAAQPSPGPSSTPPAGPAGPAGSTPLVLPNGMTLPNFPGGAATPQQYTAITKNAERQSGLIDLLKKDDEIYFDLGPDQFDRPFIVAPVLASGIGSEAFAGRIFPTFCIEFSASASASCGSTRTRTSARPPTRRRRTRSPSRRPIRSSTARRSSRRTRSQSASSFPPLSS
jgi:hypothetical protein